MEFNIIDKCTFKPHLNKFKLKVDEKPLDRLTKPKHIPEEIKNPECTFQPFKAESYKISLEGEKKVSEELEQATFWNNYLDVFKRFELEVKIVLPK